MSYTMTMPRRTRHDRASLRRRLLVRAVVWRALLASRRKPKTLQRVLTKASAGLPPVDHATAERVHREVVLASARCAGWRGCLPRSIAIALLCKREGGWPDWCVGVRATPPFAAHAWLEAERRMVGEPGEPANYRPLIRVSTA
ncbi:lasso peptide biosynthesis B2 protein [Amycolatopsis sp. NPDC059657]|uniref:lasso peptide biosynthesis B2 protein n=1 Tax=Amycolatopsis sp. NPDC059657 TaxID=3346899 RepID=UPI00367063F6